MKKAYLILNVFCRSLFFIQPSWTCKSTNLKHFAWNVFKNTSLILRLMENLITDRSPSTTVAFYNSLWFKQTPPCRLTRHHVCFRRPLVTFMLRLGDVSCFWTVRFTDIWVIWELSFYVVSVDRAHWCHKSIWFGGITCVYRERGGESNFCPGWPRKPTKATSIHWTEGWWMLQLDKPGILL